MPLSTSSLSRHVGSLLLLAALALVAIAKEVLVPIALATLLAVVLTPVVRWLVARRIPNLLAVALVRGSVSAAALLIGVIIFGQVNQVADKLVEYRHNIHARLSELSSGHGPVSKAASTIQTLQHELGSLDGDKSTKTADENRDVSKEKPQPVVIVQEEHIGIHDLLPLLATTLQPLAIIGLTMLLATFMIVQRADIQNRFGLLSSWLAKRGMSTVSGSALDCWWLRFSRSWGCRMRYCGDCSPLYCDLYLISVSPSQRD